MLAIKTEHLRKEYKDMVAVDDLNLQVRAGRAVLSAWSKRRRKNDYD